jgi:aminopeptidase C
MLANGRWDLIRRLKGKYIICQKAVDAWSSNQSTSGKHETYLARILKEYSN